MAPGSLSFALLTLSNVDFAGKTVTPKPKAGYEVDLAHIGSSGLLTLTSRLKFQMRYLQTSYGASYSYEAL